jgi:N6-L-threonylcarbamoyladenine synthase
LQQSHYQSMSLAGGVSANRELRRKMMTFAQSENIPAYIPPFEYCTDNAAMIGIAAFYRYQRKEWSDVSMVPLPALKM